MESVFSSTWNENENKFTSSTFEQVKIVKIPKIIMQTWKTKDVPTHWKSSGDAIRKFMPQWEYHLMTDSDNLEFVSRFFPDFLSYFKSFEYPIQRADAIRYMWLYVKGGVYLDLDLEILKPLDNLFFEDKELFVVRSVHTDDAYTNAFMAAKPKLRVMLQCLEEMRAPLASWHVGKHLKVVNSTGPNMFTRSIQSVKQDLSSSSSGSSFTSSSSSPFSYSNIKSKTSSEGEWRGALRSMFPKSLFDYWMGATEEDESNRERSKGEKFEVLELPAHLIVACSVCDPKPCCSAMGYCRTLGGSSWGSDTNIATVLFCNRYYLGTFLLIIFVIVVTIIILYFRKKSKSRSKY